MASNRRAFLTATAVGALAGAPTEAAASGTASVHTARSRPPFTAPDALAEGVEELRIPLVLVLGHERCGAVAATLDHLRTGASVPGHLRLLVDEIAPAARRTRALPGDWLEHTVRAHAVWARDAIRADPAFGPVQVEAARFDLDTGLVTLLP